MVDAPWQVESAVREAGRRVRHEPGVGGIQDLDVRLQGDEQDRLAFPHQLGHAVANDLVPSVRGAVYAADHPLGVADHDAGAGGQHGACTGNGQVSHDTPEPRRRDAAVSPSTSPSSSRSRADCTRLLSIALTSAATLNPLGWREGAATFVAPAPCGREPGPEVTAPRSASALGEIVAVEGINPPDFRGVSRGPRAPAPSYGP